MSTAPLPEFPIAKRHLTGQKVGRQLRKADQGRLVRYTLELPALLATAMEALAEISREGEHPKANYRYLSQYPAEIIERFVIEAFPDVFGIEFSEYVRRRSNGQSLDLMALRRNE